MTYKNAQKGEPDTLRLTPWMCLIAALCLVIACSDSPSRSGSVPQDEWLGDWEKIGSAGGSAHVTFHADGIWSLKSETHGIKVEINRAGTYRVEDDTYEVITFEQELVAIREYTQAGVWEIRGNLLKLYPDDGHDAVIIYRRI